MTAPKLRFKEFDGSWEKNSIQYFMDKKYILDQMDGNHGELYPKSEAFSIDGIPYVSATDFSSGEVDFNSCKRLPLPRAKLFKKGIAKNGDVLFAHNATVGPVTILKTDLDFVILSTTATYYRCDDNYLQNIFLKNYFESEYFIQQYFGIMSQSTRNQVPITTQRKLFISIPQIEEQTKIASFLSAVDEKITQLTQKHQLLSQYKQGMIQKLFSLKIRFKADDGSEFDEWKSIQLKDFLTFTPRPVDKPEIAYHALGVRSHFKGLFNKYDSEPQKISMDTLYTVEKDDVVVNITFAWEGAMAIAKDEHNQGLVSHRFPTYKCNESKVNLIFFNYRFIQKDFLSHLQLCSPGGAGRNRVLNKQSFLEISFEKPCVQEQTKIANFLSAIDQKIEVTEQQIEQAKQWKKGLLQQMFV